ncbi:MAG: hypothetical protein ACYTG1_12760 [Planctomycetota bacterium]|jgi:hypothetical protein
MNHDTARASIAPGRREPSSLAAAGLGLLLATAAAALPGGCKSDEPKAPRAREVSLAEFADPAVAGDAADDPDDPTGPADPGAADLEADDLPVGEAFTLGAGSTRLEPVAGGDLPVEGPSRVVIDSLVGQVNGRPIFADAFFEPIEDELIALSTQLDEREFAVRANDIVRSNLRQVVLNELFLSEAESGLTTAQQEGLFYWMQEVRELIVSKQGAGAESADIEREYERRQDEFNPPSHVTLARIRLSTTRNAVEIDEVATRLADGETFRAVAESIGQWEEEGWQAFDLGPEGLAEIELNDQARQHLVGLGVGDTTGAFELGSSTWWLHVLEFDQPEARSLYDADVQQSLGDEIYRRRSAEERQRYIDTLLDKGIYNDLNDMAERLLIIALLRYADV